MGDEGGRRELDYDGGTGTLVPRRRYQRGAVQDPELPKPPQSVRCRAGPAGGGVDRVLVLLGRQHLGLAVTRARRPRSIQPERVDQLGSADHRAGPGLAGPRTARTARSALAAMNWVRAGILAPEAVHRSSAGIAGASCLRVRH